MDIQAGTHAGPCDLISVIGKLPGKCQHGVWLGAGGPGGHCDNWYVTSTANGDFVHVF